MGPEPLTDSVGVRGSVNCGAEYTHLLPLLRDLVCYGHELAARAESAARGAGARASWHLGRSIEI